ncbi:hypothetical protein TNCV_2552891 [Trichonephila clavipes]|nr:hypothetical protein TNCV_2552891 [Trichonephila clavipes]
MGGTLNNRRAAISREIGGKRREWDVPDHSKGVLPQNWGETEKNRSDNCKMLNAKANDRRKILALSHAEFRGPLSGGTVDQVA